MVTQRGVRIISIELESHQANEFCALDRVHRIGGEQGDQDVIQLFAEAHDCGAVCKSSFREVSSAIVDFFKISNDWMRCLSMELVVFHQMKRLGVKVF